MAFLPPLPPRPLERASEPPAPHPRGGGGGAGQQTSCAWTRFGQAPPPPARAVDSGPPPDGGDGRPSIRLVNAPGAPLGGGAGEGGASLTSGGVVGSAGESTAARSSCVNPPFGTAGRAWAGGSERLGASGSSFCVGEDVAGISSWGPNSRVKSPGPLGDGALGVGGWGCATSSGPLAFQRICGLAAAGGGGSAGVDSRHRTTILGRSAAGGVGVAGGAGSVGAALAGLSLIAPNRRVNSPVAGEAVGAEVAGGAPGAGGRGVDGPSGVLCESAAAGPIAPNNCVNSPPAGVGVADFGDSTMGVFGISAGPNSCVNSPQGGPCDEAVGTVGAAGALRVLTSSHCASVWNTWR